eukprot:SAG31_NODE_15277_length_762_cov_6.357466_2_plen_100_part_00
MGKSVPLQIAIRDSAGRTSATATGMQPALSGGTISQTPRFPNLYFAIIYLNFDREGGGRGRTAASPRVEARDEALSEPLRVAVTRCHRHAAVEVVLGAA